MRRVIWIVISVVSLFSIMPSVSADTVEVYGTIHGFKLLAPPSTAQKKYITELTDTLMTKKSWSALNSFKKNYNSPQTKYIYHENLTLKGNRVILSDNGIDLSITPESVIWDSSGKIKGEDWIFAVRNIGPKPSSSAIQSFSGTNNIESYLHVSPLGLALITAYSALYGTMVKHYPHTSKIPSYYGQVEVDFVDSDGHFISDSNPYLENAQIWTLDGKQISTNNVPDASVFQEWFEQVVDP